MKNYGDLEGCYPPRPTASTDNTLLDLDNSSEDNQPHSLIVNYSSSNSLSFPCHYIFLVADVIKAMPSNKAPGIDKMPTRVLKDSLLITLPFITSVINASLLASAFSEVWKTAEITPIPKQANHELPNSNRPISLLPALSKVCERVAYNQFVTYLTTKERLTTKQSGNKKWFSTETSLIHTTDAFLKGIDDKKLTACVP